ARCSSSREITGASARSRARGDCRAASEPGRTFAEPPTSGDGPEINRILAAVAPNVQDLLREPVAHVVPMRDDARAALELALQLRAHREVQLAREKERDHRCLAKVCGEEVFVQEPDAIDDIRLARIFPALGNARGVDIDTDAARSELARGRDDDASVA